MMTMMQGSGGLEPKNKEQFRLLQYSDDSKSLSDLELTEIVVPRKRKVRRKTKPKNGHRHHRRQGGDGSASGGSCKNIGIWVAIASNVGLLLLLSYIVSMVHSEYANLDKQQTKLAASIKTLPDEWHDKAHGLEVNQSTLFHKLFDLQQSLQNLTEEFMQLRVIVQQQQTQANEVGRVKILEKSLADFGASLKSFSGEMDVLKDRSAKVTETVTDHTQAIEYFRSLVVNKRLNETSSIAEGVGCETNETLQVKKDLLALKDLTQSLSDRLDSVNATFTTFATVEQQKVDQLEKNHTNKINDLNDSVANITAQDVNRAMKNYQDQIKGLEDRLTSIEQVAEVLQKGQQGVEELKSQLDGFNAAMQRLQQKEVGGGSSGDVADPDKRTQTTTTGSNKQVPESGSPPIM